METKIRKATLDDLSAIFELESAVGKYPYPLVVIRQHFDLGSTLLVSEGQAGKLASYILGAFNPHTRIAHIVAVMTRPEYRRKGISKQLGIDVMTELRKLSPIEFQAVVSPDNTASLALFESLGFAKKGIEGNYYGGGEDRIILRKDV